jgi:pSer/pThr/pTyr-binding forkhead associated (FHA) protein
MPTLMILKATAGDLRGQEFAINGPANCVLGRSRSCGLRLPGDPTVSRQHCVIEIGPGRAWVQDLGSLNGTHLNGDRIGVRDISNGDATMVAPPRRPLCHGDELRVCANIFQVELVVEPSAQHHTLSMCG